MSVHAVAGQPVQVHRNVPESQISSKLTSLALAIIGSVASILLIPPPFSLIVSGVIWMATLFDSCSDCCDSRTQQVVLRELHEPVGVGHRPVVYHQPIIPVTRPAVVVVDPVYVQPPIHYPAARPARVSEHEPVGAGQLATSRIDTPPQPRPRSVARQERRYGQEPARRREHRAELPNARASVEHAPVGVRLEAPNPPRRPQSTESAAREPVGHR